MKLRYIMLLLLVGPAPFCRAQLDLNPGDVWTYPFSTMNFQYTTIAFGPPGGQLSLFFSSFPSGTIRYEVWEGAPQGAPMGSGLVSGGGPGGGFVGGWSWAWQDLNGTLRLTMLTGSCSVASVHIEATRPAAINPLNRFDIYAASVSFTSPPPRLVAQRLPTAVEVSWWTNGSTGYVLESANALATNQWSLVPASPIIVSNRYVVTVGTNESAAYFRLRK